MVATRIAESADARLMVSGAGENPQAMKPLLKQRDTSE
jgi:hypothetical protein